VGHLLVAVVSAESGKVVEELRRRHHDVGELRRRAQAALPPSPKQSFHGVRRWGSDEAVQVTTAFMTVLDGASALARASGDTEVDEFHLWSALATCDQTATTEIAGAIDLEPFPEQRPSRDSRVSTSSWPLEKLAKYGRILTDEARDGLLDPVIGRTRETERLIHILGRRRKNNPVLLGEPGVGKTAIVEGLAQAIAESQVPSSIAGRHIFALDIGSLVAGTKYRGEFESRIQELLEGIRSSEGGIILFIDEVHLIARAGGAEGAINAAGFLKPMLARGELRAIGATTIADYRDQVVRDGALERRFQPIHVKEPSPGEALEMLRGLRPRYESHHGLVISDSALVVAVEASQLRVLHRNLPDKAIDLIDEASSRKRAMAEAIEPSDQLDSLEVTPDDVVAVLEDWIGGEYGEWSREVYGDTEPGSARD
jgi:ATP-dependent Clp protease ATP-binding subunit ClpA